jgi:hypothetical protein
MSELSSKTQDFEHMMRKGGKFKPVFYLQHPHPEKSGADDLSP